jgi:hypothetical protein
MPSRDLSTRKCGLDADFVATVPVFVNVRDRLSCLKQLLGWLERAGHRNITLIDNASTYPPLLRFLQQCGHQVVCLRRNLGHTALWRIRQFRSVIAQSWFIYTDPDVVPAECCPPDAAAHLYSLLQRFPNYLKAGLGLRLDDIPDCYHLKQKVIRWEQQLIGKEIAPGVFQADVDTTFALHRPGTPYITGPSMRVHGIYEARHLPWYADSESPDEEELYYRGHASVGVTTWNTSVEIQQQNCPVGGGTAAQLEADPYSLLNHLRNLKFGRIARAIGAFRRVLRLSSAALTNADAMNFEQAQQAVLALIRSEEWSLAWRLTEPVRQFTSKCRRKKGRQNH